MFSLTHVVDILSPRRRRRVCRQEHDAARADAGVKSNERTHLPHDCFY